MTDLYVDKPVSKCEEKYIKYFSKTRALAEVISERELQKYCETQFVSKNKNLSAMVMSLLEKTVEQDGELYHYVKNNRWRELDWYIRGNPGKLIFFRILTQFFLFRYYSSPDIEITRKQFQIALGIQQVRWMVDDENPNKIIKYAHIDVLVDDAYFDFWEDIPAADRRAVLSQISKNMNALYDHDKGVHSSGDDYHHLPISETNQDKKIKAEKAKQQGEKVKQVNQKLKGTIWYRVSKPTLFNFTQNRIMPYFTIPETFNFSNIMCKYAPTLIFGSISEQSFLKYQLLYNMRPYAAHLPDSTSNLTIISGSHRPIVVHWAYGYLRQFNTLPCDISSAYNYINIHCKKAPIEPYEKVTSENIVEQIENNGTFQQCMDSVVPFADYYATPLGERIAGILNDNGRLYGIVPVIE